MNFDFSLLLVAGTFVTGAGWLIDKWFFAQEREARIASAAALAEGTLSQEDQERIEKLPFWADISRSFFPVLAVVLVLRSFLVEPFQIPSGSMLPTLKIGDFILVNKYHYGLRLPVLNTKVVELNTPERGDVAVFKYPDQPSINYIKRVVGLPGDVVRYQGKKLYINGVEQPQTLKAKLPPNILLDETLGEVEHEIYVDVSPNPRVEGEWIVPAGQYFVMGDNRDNSNDSRIWGFVPDELLVGKAFAVWMHWPTLLSIPDFSAVRSID